MCYRHVYRRTSGQTFKERSKRKADTIGKKDKEDIPVSGSNAADLLDAANVCKRKRIGNGEKKRRNVPRPIIIRNRAEEHELSLISKEISQEERGTRHSQKKE